MLTNLNPDKQIDALFILRTVQQSSVSSLILDYDNRGG